MIKKLILIFALLPSLALSQHTIQGTFSPADNYSWIILYKITPTATEYVKNVEVKDTGNISIELGHTDSKGIYKLVYALPQQDYNFDVIYDGEEDIVFTFSEDKGIEFTKSAENKLLASYTKSMVLINQTLNSFYSKGSHDETAYMKIVETLKDAQNSFENASKGKMVAHFIKANAPYIPSSFEDSATYFNHVKAAYLEHVDFNDPVLQSSDFLIQRILSYVFDLNKDHSTATYKTNVDTVAEAIKTTQLQYQSVLLEVLWNQFVETQNGVMANYVADTHLIPIAKALENQKLVNKLMVYKNTAIGNVAPDFSFKIQGTDGEKETTTMHQLKGHQQYLILFWSSTCGHCLAELPILKKYLDSNPENDIQVVAIGLEEAHSPWDKESLKYPEFIHIFGEGKWDNPISDAYGVTGTPSFFLLDAEKHILAKPDDVEALKTFLENHPITSEKQ